MDKQQFVDKLHRYKFKYNIPKILKAVDLAIFHHKTQKRHSGEPYYQHPLAVADIIAEINLDTDSVIAAILHDTVEDTDLSLVDIEKEFGSRIAKIVDGVTKFDKINFKSKHIRQAENFRKLLLAMVDDIRVLLIKLADRLHNMRTIEFVTSVDKRKRIALETLELYAPLAERIGMHNIKIELQDICFKILYPDVRNLINDKFKVIFNDSKKIINDIISELKNLLCKEHELSAEIHGRKKTLYSIWMKMQHKNVSLDELSDIIAFRIIVAEKLDCYKALGLIHQKYKTIPHKFGDFISTPKQNGYSSLHTVVIGPFAYKIEIQIRTEEMHQVAEYGVAAHWKYKQNYADINDYNNISWFAQLTKILERSTNPDELMQHTKMEMYYDQVFCFSQNGDLIALPKSATVIDFAYSLGEDIGNRCIRAKVNNIDVPIHTVLVNGNVVEIITTKNNVVVPEWENFVVTGAAKSSIKKALINRNRVETIKIGEKILNSLFYYLTQSSVNKIIKKYCIVIGKDVAQVMYDLGSGKMNIKQFQRDILFAQDSSANNHTDNNVPLLCNAKDEIIIPIKGIESYHNIIYAECCNPIVGEKIIGLHAGNAIEIHLHDCIILKQKYISYERLVQLEWDETKVNVPSIYRIRLYMIHSSASFAQLMDLFAKHDFLITNIQFLNRNSNFFELSIDFTADNKDTVHKLLDKLYKQEFIQFVVQVRI